MQQIRLIKFVKPEYLSNGRMITKCTKELKINKTMDNISLLVYIYHSFFFYKTEMKTEQLPDIRVKKISVLPFMIIYEKLDLGKFCHAVRECH